MHGIYSFCPENYEHEKETVSGIEKAEDEEERMKRRKEMSIEYEKGNEKKIN